MKKGSLILALLLYLLALGALATLFRGDENTSVTDNHSPNSNFYGIPVEGIDFDQTNFIF